MVPSAGSKAGQKFIGAGAQSDGIPNLGEMACDMIVESGDTGKITFQAAKVRKPLVSVWGINQKGNPVCFVVTNPTLC